MTTPALSGVRCAVHAVRRAVDLCPVCRRPRCAADAVLAPGGGCPVCLGAAGRPPLAPATALEQLVRAALAAGGAALLGGIVAAQYVGAELFGYLTPLVVGVLVAVSAQAASGAPRTGPVAQRLRLLCCAYAVLGTALGFVLEESRSAFATDNLLAYVAAVAGVIGWMLPPKRPAGPRD